MSTLPAGSDLVDSRLAQLLADLRFTPAERVRAADETARVSHRLHPCLVVGASAMQLRGSFGGR